jgi:hypothetical protein
MKQRTGKFDVAAKMPRLAHKRTGAEFDHAASEVMTWLCSQRSIRQYVMDACYVRGLIAYDKASNTWRGRDAR